MRSSLHHGWRMWIVSAEDKVYASELCINPRFQGLPGLMCWGDLKPRFGNSWWWLFGCFSMLERSGVCFRLTLPMFPGVSGSRLLLNLYKVFGITCEHACRALSMGSFHVLTHPDFVTRAVNEWTPQHIQCRWSPFWGPRELDTSLQTGGPVRRH